MSGSLFSRLGILLRAGAKSVLSGTLGRPENSLRQTSPDGQYAVVLGRDPDRAVASLWRLAGERQSFVDIADQLVLNAALPADLTRVQIRWSDDSRRAALSLDGRLIGMFDLRSGRKAASQEANAAGLDTAYFQNGLPANVGSELARNS